jgi:DNA-directed RNA polymerase subunit RPC12/RpoP
MVDIKKPGRCAKCGGNEIPENDDGEWEIVCIQCGRRRSANGTPPPRYVNENCFSRGQGKKWNYRRPRLKNNPSSTQDR